ncbi:MAG: HlyD family efflux transporter periplasmic adaptor subunit [Wenzhouxiangellaceae bacterium]
MKSAQPSITLAVLIVAMTLSGCADDDPASPILGTLERHRLELVAEASEPVIELAVDEGQFVTAGQILARLDDRRLRQQLKAAEAMTEQAQQRLVELQRGPRQEHIANMRSQLAGATAQRINRQQEYQRVSEVVERGLQSVAALDQALAQRDQAIAHEEALRAELEEMLNGTRIEQLAQAEAQVQQTRAEVEHLQLTLQRLQITAPVAGLIDDLPYRVGEQPPVGAPVVILLDGSELYARVYVPLAQRTAFAAGSKVEVSVNLAASGRPEQQLTYPGKVRWIASDSAYTPFFALNQHDRGRLVYQAEIDLPAEVPAPLAAGLPVTVRSVDGQP